MDLYSYMNYRDFLRDWYAQEKAKKRHFSFRYFARIAGLSSSGFLKMVMDGERNLSASSINQFIRGLKLNRREAAFFEALVLFNQAVNEQERDLYFERLVSLKPPVKLTGLAKDQYEYFSQKHFVIIREMVALPHFQEDPEWIAKRIRPPLKAREVEYAIEVLSRLGLLKRDPEGKLIQADSSLTTPAEVHEVEIYQFHQAMLSEAKEAMLKVLPELRDITSLTIPIPRKSLGMIKEKIKAFREEIIHVINQGEPDYFEVYQLNMQLFPVTRTHDGTEGVS